MFIARLLQTKLRLFVGFGKLSSLPKGNFIFIRSGRILDYSGRYSLRVQKVENADIGKDSRVLGHGDASKIDSGAFRGG